MKNNRGHWLGLVLMTLALAFGVLGCQQRPAPVPTVALSPTEPVVVVVVTATTQPTLAPTNTVEPTITPLPTFTPEVTATVTATLQAQATITPTQAAAVEPTQAPAQNQPTTAATEAPPPANFSAPRGVSPEGIAFRDGDTVKLVFASVGPLTRDQCYRFDITLGNPSGPGGVGDYWVGMCGDQSAAGSNLRFDIKPARFRDEPNYGTLVTAADNVIPATSQYIMKWFVTPVKMVDATDPVHPQVQALGPAGLPLENTWFR